MTQIFHRIGKSGGFATQKASGLAATQHMAEAASEYSQMKISINDICKATVATAIDIIKNVDTAYLELKGFGLTFPIFCRPCPTVPRHGFVDSGLVKDKTELLAMCCAAVEADTDAEIIVMKQLDGAASAIITNSTVAIGPGNDGATSGRSVTLYGPVLDAASAAYAQMLKTAKIAEGDFPYIEAVEHVERWSLVQVRGGPEVPACVDFIPKAMLVKKVLKAHVDYDLLQWEKDVAAGAKVTGFVVDASSMSLTSHFAVHAVVNKVAVVTSHKVKVGDKLKPVGISWKETDYKRLAKEIDRVDYSLTNPATAGLVKDEALAQMAVGALHLAGQPVPASDAQLRLTAYGVVGAVKLMAVACIGETRHSRGCSSYVRSTSRRDHHIKVDQEKVKASLTIIQQMTAGKVGTSREACYSLAKHIPLAGLGSIMYPVGLVFRDVTWDSAYGGEAWAGIVSGVRAMIRALQQFSRKPNANNWAKVVELWNEAINREHNGGAPALSKFSVSKYDMDKLSRVPLAAVLSIPLHTCWTIFGDPFKTLFKKIDPKHIKPVHIPVTVPPHIVIPSGEREDEDVKRTKIKGHIRLIGPASLRFEMSSTDGFADIPTNARYFNVHDLFSRAVKDRIIEILTEYGGALPCLGSMTSEVKSASMSISRRFSMHIKTIMFYAGIDRMELPATTSTDLNTLALKVGVGTGFKATIARDGMKKFKFTSSPIVEHSADHDRDEDSYYDPEDDDCERQDW